MNGVTADLLNLAESVRAVQGAQIVTVSESERLPARTRQNAPDLGQGILQYLQKKTREVSILTELLTALLTNAVLPAASFALAWLIQQQRLVKRNNKAIQDGVCALLKYEIMKICLRCEQNQAVAYSDNEALNSMYEAYRALGGNGAAAEMREKIRLYPIVTADYIRKLEHDRGTPENPAE